ncbi:hypothetical protein ACTHO5_00785 [Cytobacillus praedii]
MNMFPFGVGGMAAILNSTMIFKSRSKIGSFHYGSFSFGVNE